MHLAPVAHTRTASAESKPPVSKVLLRLSPGCLPPFLTTAHPISPKLLSLGLALFWSSRVALEKSYNEVYLEADVEGPQGWPGRG